MANGPVPFGSVVCHHCDNPSCVRVAHLFVGTMADNCLDRDAKGRQRTSYGVDRPAAKLDPDKVRAIRSSPDGCWKLAKRFGVARSTIKAVRNRRSWKHVD
jgi:hypothetical protein